MNELAHLRLLRTGEHGECLAIAIGDPGQGTHVIVGVDPVGRPLPLMRLYQVSNDGAATHACVLVLAPDEARALALAESKLKEHAAADRATIFLPRFWNRLTVTELTGNTTVEWTSEVRA